MFFFLPRFLSYFLFFSGYFVVVIPRLSRLYLITQSDAYTLAYQTHTNLGPTLLLTNTTQHT
ncbi:hypothetical protein M422DRAFT_36546 [Sphaerobolus stellatus SS14]|uniref:Unplaced genomic scaffold SPHSTscaffold_186, whole genome shotgun sequence n=1 Tax=Sphaerobolus stellatus (strain SS14) TaxID=990650 RepID=A0A0C9U7Z1_SPHS4|nr:hypothetical protein M422DRAFT_36546 [Sphaerobolus stellatus SS14]